MDCSKNNNTSKHNTSHLNTKIHNTSELMCCVVSRCVAFLCCVISSLVNNMEMKKIKISKNFEG